MKRISKNRFNGYAFPVEKHRFTEVAEKRFCWRVAPNKTVIFLKLVSDCKGGLFKQSAFFAQKSANINAREVFWMDGGKVILLKKPNKYGKYLLLLFVLPAFLFHFLFVLLPSCATLVLSFFEWNGIATPVFNGFDNYTRMFADVDFHKAIINNLKWIACFITIPVFLGLASAILISRLRKTQMFFRTAYFLPYIIASAMAGRIWSSYMNPYFGFNSVFKQLGWMELGATQWLGNPEIALFSVAFVDIWHFWGFVMVLFVGALEQVDPVLYESARVEGANKLQELRYITLPGIMPTTTFIIITIIMWSFLTFDYIWVMTGGGPGEASEVVSTLVYRTAFIRYDTGYANALCVTQSVLSILAYSLLQISKKKGADAA